MLLIITPNPALDRTMVFQGLRLGGVFRTDEVIVAAGGKGLNVARAARTLGQPALVCAPLGGLTGDMVARLAAAEGLAGRWTRHQAGETRTCVLVVDREASDATALNESGPIFAPADWHAFAGDVLAAASGSALAVVSGSLPRGVAPADLGALLVDLASRGLQVIVDTSGPALEAALATQPWGVKVNGHEAGAALGRPVSDVPAALAALATLRAQGVSLAAVSLGALGCVAADASGAWWARPPRMRIVSSVGSGDSLLAGLATGLLRGMNLPEALRLGVACGAADALTIGGGRFDLREVENLRVAVHVEARGIADF
ncbi:MAG: hexose kinase [Oscillochloridaceae bacterium]|nr:hexose kinase [Chloroflexaceae bacterium]MDW8391278.1 hexose kinase [Oscillochloridaceae bacterium]